MSQDQADKTAIPQKHTNSLNVQLLQVGAGAAASTGTRFFCQPFEVLKIRFQLQIEPIAGSAVALSKYTSLGQACQIIYKEEGIRGFWKGHKAGQFLSIAYGMVQFWSYEQILLILAQPELMGNFPNTNRFISGSLSGIVGVLVSTPFDVVRTRLVSQDTGSGYKSATNATLTILSNEGLRGLYRGLSSSTFQIIPYVGLNFLAYGFMKDVGVTFFETKQHSDLPTWYMLFSGALCGTGCKIIVYPLDLVKRRLQIQGFHDHRKTYGKNLTCDGIVNCLKLTLREEGPLGLYKGMYPTLMKSAVATALYFGAYDKIKTLTMDVE